MQTMDAIVVGAGLSGLTAAHQLHKAGQNVIVLEASSHIGGMIQTYTEEGFTIEAGPNTFPSTATAILDLCQQLHIQPEPAQAAHKRYLFLNKQLTVLPGNPLQFLTSPILSPAGKLRLLQEPFVTKTNSNDISLVDFFTNRFGPEVTQNLIDPFISGIYAGNIDELSLPAVFPKLWEWEQSKGSIIKGVLASFKKSANTRADEKMTLLSFRGGLQTLTDSLLQALPETTVQTKQQVTRIEQTNSGYTIEVSSGTRWNAKQLILATPAFINSKLLQAIAPLTSQLLSKIPYAGLSVVHTGFHEKDIPNPLNGFGFLVPSKEKTSLLGSIWASSLFPNRAPQGQVLLSNFIGGIHHPEIATKTDTQVQQIVLKHLENIFKTTKPLAPTFSKVLFYEQAIPQYALGHVERIQRIEQDLKSLHTVHLCGNYLHGISLNQCVQSGLDAAKNVLGR